MLGQDLGIRIIDAATGARMGGLVLVDVWDRRLQADGAWQLVRDVKRR